MTANVFVIGLDELNRSTLRTLPGASRYHFHQLLTIDELQHGEVIDVEELLEKAQRELEGFDGSVDAIVGYWDFPVTLMVPILCQRFGLASASLEAILKCEHKYWSRLEQQKVIDEYPRFGIIDPADDHAGLPDAVSYPAWVKPVKSTSSELAYRVDDDESLRKVLARERAEIGRVGQPFSFLLSMVSLPDEVAEAGGQGCVVEESASGDQVTVEGYSYQGQVKIYGIVDSIRYPDASSFLRYQYPTSLPDQVIERLMDVSRRVISSIGLDNSTFNIEYFWDPERDRLTLLEVNPRHSQSHARLFQLVDGLPNHKCMIDLALGHEPDLPNGEGPYEIAGKWFHRRFGDGVVRRVPWPSEIARLEQEVPGTTIHCCVDQGDRLGDLHGQDSYSFDLAEIFIGAHDEEELERKYQRCVESLRFEFDE